MGGSGLGAIFGGLLQGYAEPALKKQATEQMEAFQMKQARIRNAMQILNTPGLSDQAYQQAEQDYSEALSAGKGKKKDSMGLIPTLRVLGKILPKGGPEVGDKTGSLPPTPKAQGMGSPPGPPQAVGGQPQGMGQIPGPHGITGPLPAPFAGSQGKQQAQIQEASQSVESAIKGLPPDLQNEARSVFKAQAAVGKPEQGIQDAFQVVQKYRALTDEEKVIKDKNDAAIQAQKQQFEESSREADSLGLQGADRANYIAGRELIKTATGGKPSEEDKAISDYLAAHGLKETPGNRNSARIALKAAERAPEKPSAEDKAVSDHLAAAGLPDTPANRDKARVELAQGKSAARAEGTQQAKETQGLKDIVSAADEAKDLQKAGDAGNSEADVALTLAYFKVMKGTAGAGIRFTTAEQNMITGARSLSEALEVKGNKVFANGQPLSKQQRQRIVDTMQIAAKAAQRQGQGGMSNPPGMNDAKPIKTADDLMNKYNISPTGP